MRQTLHGKLVLALFSVLVLTLVLFWAVGPVFTRQFLGEMQQKLHRDLAQHLVAESLPLRDGQVQQDNLEHIFHVLMLINPSIEVYLLDSEGRILGFSAPEGVVVRNQVDLEPVHRFVTRQESLPILGDDPRSSDRRKVFSAAALGTAAAPEGFLYVVLAGQQWDSAVAMLSSSTILRLGAIVMAVGSVVVLILGWWVFAWVTRPMRLLEQRMSGLRANDFHGHKSQLHRDEPPRDEIDSLARTFDAMAQKLTSYISEIEKTDELRRELVANISHDLRTPLTSLRGFLETVHLKWDSLSDTERSRYLDAAIQQTERLNRLVTDLFELARLESGTQEMNIEPLALAELAQDAVQQFHLLAADRGVTVEATPPGGSGAVEGDVGLLARVLDNLLDNGVRYTPPGGKVTVSVQESPRWVTLEVADTGQGIEPQDLPRVFDRFFHPDRNGVKTEGAGLGLAIARRIVELHGGSIHVESDAGLGTKFAIQLPAVGSAM